jgi:hypothetical protein
MITLRRQRLETRRVLSLCLAVAAASAASAQTVRYVDAGAGGSADGTSWANAYTSLASALAAATGGQEIWVADGTYTPGAAKSSTFQLKGNVALYGGFRGTETAVEQRVLNVATSVLSGEIGDPGMLFDNCDHVVTAESGALLDGFTIAFGCSTANNGGGLYNIQKGMTVRNCTFARNYADGTGNTPGGGGVYFDGNSASGLFLMDRCQFFDNSTLGSGGAVMIRGTAANFRIDNSLFVGNVRGLNRWGGDIANERGSAASIGHIVNCTFLNPPWESVGSGTIGGAGQAGHLKLVNCVLYKDGIGTNWIGRVMNGGEITIHNCLVDGAWNIGTSVGYMNIVGTQLRFTDPEFADLGATNLHLLVTSPCVDTGTSGTTPAITMPVVDLEGTARPLNGLYDMGAYEGGVPVPLPSGMTLILR